MIETAITLILAICLCAFIVTFTAMVLALMWSVIKDLLDNKM